MIKTRRSHGRLIFIMGILYNGTPVPGTTVFILRQVLSSVGHIVESTYSPSCEFEICDCYDRHVNNEHTHGFSPGFCEMSRTTQGGPALWSGLVHFCGRGEPNLRVMVINVAFSHLQTYHTRTMCCKLKDMYAHRKHGHRTGLIIY